MLRHRARSAEPVQTTNVTCVLVGDFLDGRGQDSEADGACVGRRIDLDSAGAVIDRSICREIRPDRRGASFRRAYHDSRAARRLLPACEAEPATKTRVAGGSSTAGNDAMAASRAQPWSAKAAAHVLHNAA